MEKEVWKDIVGYEGLYQISNKGRVKSLSRIDAHNHLVKEKIRSLGKDRYGYLFANLKKEGKQRNYSVHRLVAIAFISNPDNKAQVNHIDGNKANNDVNNLEWCTCSENLKHAYEIGLKKPKGPTGELCGTSKLTWDDVHWIREHYVQENRNSNIGIIAQKYNISRKEVLYIVNNQRWKE